MLRKLKRFLNQLTFFYFRNQLNGRFFLCLRALIVYICLSFLFLFLYIYFLTLGKRFIILAITSGWIIVYSFYYFIEVLVYDSRTNSILRLKNKLLERLEVENLVIDDLLKLISCNHKVITIKRAKINYEVLNYLYLLIEDELVKNRIATLKEYTLKRLDFLNVQKDSKEYCYENRLFVNGYDYINIRDVDYITDQFNDLIKFIKEKKMHKFILTNENLG